MRIKLVSELKTGDEFIWGSDKTRANMCVMGEDLGPLIFTKMELGDPLNNDPTIGGRVFWLSRSMNENSRWFLKTDMVLVRQYDNDYDIDFRVRCMHCGDPYGEHMLLKCVNGGYFIPLQNDLERMHPDYKMAVRGDAEEFFNSIGL
jgi:hypothetical protein